MKKFVVIWYIIQCFCVAPAPVANSYTGMTSGSVNVVAC